MTYSAIVAIIYGGLSPSISIIILGIIVAIYGLAGCKTLLLLPCLLYPFMFLIRIPDHHNIILIGISDITAILAILLCICLAPKKNNNLKFDLISIYLFLLAILSFIISAAHIQSIESLPYIFRQYVLPVIFTITFINASYKDETLPQRALSLSVFSFTLVGFIALLNYLSILSIPPLFEEIYPTSSYMLDIDTGTMHGRFFAGSDLIPRMNFFLGGALGSAAGILTGLFIISFFNFAPRVNRGLAIICGVLLITSASLSISYTILFSIIIAIVIFIYIYIKKYFFFKLLIVIALIYYLTISIDLAGTSAYNYYKEYVIENLYGTIMSSTNITFLLGNGPRLATTGYDYVVGGYTSDIGIFRILLEQGIINFTIFIVIIFMTLKKYFTAGKKAFLVNNFPFILIIIIMLFSIHTIMTFTPPFYPLFALSMAGIYLKNKKSRI